MGNTIKKTEFLQAVVNTIKMVSDEPIDVRVADVERNNGKYDCIQVNYGQNACSNIGVDTYYQMFCGGDFSAVTNAAEAIIQAQKSQKEQMDNVQDIARKAADYEWAKHILRCRLVNTALNRDVLDGMPNIPFHDLSITFYLDLDGNQGLTVNVTDSLLAAWDISIDKLFADVVANMQAGSPARLQSMFEVMAEVETIAQMEEMGCSLQEMTELEEDLAEGMKKAAEDAGIQPLYRLSNKAVYGAAVILYPGVLETCAEAIGGDYYLIPSSIHEFLLSPVTYMGPDELRDLIQNVNRTTLPPEDVLSDHAYLYSVAQKKIIMV